MAPCPAAGRNSSSGSTAVARLGEAEPIQPGERQQRARAFPFGELAQTRLHVAAQQGDLKVRADALQHRAAAQGGGPHAGPVRQVARGGGDGRDPRVAHVLARQKARHRDRVRQERREVLGRMHGDVDAAHHQGGVELLGEQPLAAGLAQRTVEDRVAARLDDVDLDGAHVQRVRSQQAIAKLMSLRKRERAAARADAERGGKRHGHRPVSSRADQASTSGSLVPRFSNCHPPSRRPRQSRRDSAST